MAMLLLLDFINFRFHSQGTIVEGVGDEVLIGLASTLGLIALVSILYNTQGRPRTIHPSQEENVQIVRDRLGFIREDGREPTGSSEGPPLPNAPPVTYSSDHRCPVCLTDTKFRTTTNCGHVFCGKSSSIDPFIMFETASIFCALILRYNPLYLRFSRYSLIRCDL